MGENRSDLAQKCIQLHMRTIHVWFIVSLSEGRNM